MFPVGWPLAGYSSTTDREDDQRSKMEDFYRDKLMPLGDKYFEDEITGSLTVSYGSRQVQELYLFSQVIFRTAKYSCGNLHDNGCMLSC